MTWDAMEDERDRVMVHAEVPSSDRVRTFYEIPEVVAAHIVAVNPRAAFVDNIVSIFEAIDTFRDSAASLEGGRS